MPNRHIYWSAVGVTLETTGLLSQHDTISGYLAALDTILSMSMS